MATGAPIMRTGSVADPNSVPVNYDNTAGYAAAPDQQVILLADGSRKYVNPDGTYTIVAPDGSAVPHFGGGGGSGDNGILDSISTGIANVGGSVNKVLEKTPGYRLARSVLDGNGIPGVKDLFGGIVPDISGIGGIGGIGGGGSANPSVLTDDINRSRTLSDQFNSQYNNYTPGVAPTIAQTTLAPQRDAVAGTVGYVPQVVAPTVGGPERVQAATVGNFSNAQGAGAYGGVAQGSAATAGFVGPIERAIAERAAAERLDPTQQAEFRARQNDLIGYLTGAIDGTAPSVAKLQLDQATERNAANQLGLASAASRGGNSALALRTAANNIGLINQKAAADAALLRAQEIATARGQYGDVANAGRTADINLADRNATLATDVSKTNATLGTQVNTTNATNDLTAKTTQAKLDTDASVATAGNQTQASVATANNATQASVASANNATQASIANSNNSLAQQIAQAKLTQEAGTTNANNATTLQQLQAQLLYNASHDNAGNALSAAETNAKLLSEASNTNANNATTLNVNQGQLTNAANINNANNVVTTRGQDITERNNIADNAIKSQGQVIQGDANILDNQTKKDVANTEMKGKIIAAGLEGAGGALSVLTKSDRNAKTDIGDGEASAQDLLDHLSARTFRYRDPADGKGRQTGVMAQDVERSPAGRAFVRETPQGKALDSRAGFGSVLAMLATLNDRLDRVEGARA